MRFPRLIPLALSIPVGFLLGTTLLGTTIGIAQDSPVESARVSIPYPELRRLLDAAQAAETEKPEEKPPVEAALQSARYQLDLAATPPTFSVTYSAQIFTETWHAIPLCSGGINLTESETAGTDSIVRRDDGFILMTNQAGEREATLTFAVPPLDRWHHETGLGFSPGPSTVNELRVTGTPEGKVVAIEGMAPSGGDAGEPVFFLPGDSHEIRLKLLDIEETAERPVLPSAWTLHSQVIARFEDGRLRHAARIQAQAENGSGLSLTLILPASASRVTVEAEDLDRFQLLPRDEAGRRVRLDWKTRDTLDRTFTVNWDRPQSALADSWILAPPQAELPEDADATGIGESRSLMALVPVAGLELTHPELQTGVDSKHLPTWLREQVGADESLTAEINGPDTIELAAVWLPRVDTAEATVSEATFETRLVADGSILVMADYTIHHNSPIDWQLELPSADQILTCEVNQSAARPIQRENKRIEFRLPAPRLEIEEGQPPGSTVHLCYSMKLEPLDPVSGSVAVELPQTELFIHRLDWALSIPPRYEPTAIEGNVEVAHAIDPVTQAATNKIRLTKELCRDEKPAVEIYYQRKDLEPGS